MTDLDYKKVAWLKTGRDLLIALAAGGAYYVIYRFLHFRYFCWLYTLTGYKCGTCGVTRMCVSIIEFHFVDAFWYNPFIFVTLPFLIPEVIYSIYILESKGHMPKWNRYLLIGYAVLVVLFGVVRNFIGV